MPNHHGLSLPIKYLTPATSTLLLMGMLAFAAGCTHRAATKQKLEAKILEAARINNQAAADALNLQPVLQRDAFTETARACVAQNQRLLGAPAQTLDVAQIVSQATTESLSSSNPFAPAKGVFASDSTNDLLALNVAINRALKDSFAEQNRLVAKQRAVTDTLIQSGLEAEVRRNARISFWSRWAVRLGVPFAALVALMVLAPATLPIIGRLLAWLVGKIPALAGYAGVVGTRVLDATVQGIERWTQKHQATAEPASAPSPNAASATAQNPQSLLNELSRAMDASHKALVRQRKKVMSPKSA